MHVVDLIRAKLQHLSVTRESKFHEKQSFAA